MRHPTPMPALMNLDDAEQRQHRESEERQQRAARLRAARHYAGFTQDELSRALAEHGKNVTPPQLKEYENGRRRITLDVLFPVADVCGVPRWFMEHGFGAPAEIPENVRLLVSQLEPGLDQLARTIFALQQALEVPSTTVDDAVRRFSGPSDVRDVGH